MSAPPDLRETVANYSCASVKLAISGIPTTVSDDLVIITPTGDYAIDALAGVDTLRLNFRNLSWDVRHSITGDGAGRYDDEHQTSVAYSGFERFELMMGRGDDHLVGGALNDLLDAGAGDDCIKSGLGADTVLGGAGIDRWSADYSSLTLDVALDLRPAGATIAATGARLTGIEAISLITGAGDDAIISETFGRNDVIQTGAGDDYVALGRGHDQAYGGEGADTLHLDWSAASNRQGDITHVALSDDLNRYSNGADQLDYQGFEMFDMVGGAGDDVLFGAGSNDTLTGNAGNDLLNGGGGRDVVSGGLGTDTYVGLYGGLSGGATLILTAQGAGTLVGPGTWLTGIENVRLTTGSGSDVIDLGAARGNDLISTGVGDDIINLGRGLRESADGGYGHDLLTLNASLATSGLETNLYYGAGYTRVVATDRSYIADFACIEQINLTGSRYGDQLSGLGQGDTLSGGAGNDSLDGRGGNDYLVGGAGADVFLFTTPAEAGHDLLGDLARGDRIRLDDLAISGRVLAGSGAAAQEGQVYLSFAAGISTLNIGLDDDPGADLTIDLLGRFTAQRFVLSGSDLLIL